MISWPLTIPTIILKGSALFVWFADINYAIM